MTIGLSNQKAAFNLAAIAKLDPHLARSLTGIGRPNSRLVTSESGDVVNLDLGGSTLYPAAARPFAARQAEDYLANPERLTFGVPTPPAHWTLLSEPIGAATARFVADRPAALAGATDENPGASLIVFGIGLGFHLPLLFERLAFRHLVLVEPYLEFLHWSLGLHDWALWLTQLAARGGSVRFLIGDNPAEVSQALFWHLRGDPFGTLDGSYIYHHYSNGLLDQCHRDLVEQQGGVVSASKGFFEDELLMFGNARANLSRPGFRIVRKANPPARPLPAVIVAAGPSLDQSLPLLRELRDDAVMFSAGSTLRSLVAHGIAPDFHCEIENAPEIHDYLAEIHSRTPLSALTLLSSITVDPRVPPMFGRRLHYMRDYNLSELLFSDAAKTIENTAPGCVNLALRMAILFGFREIYLVGTDFGRREDAAHHAADSIWLTDPDWSDKYRRNVEEMAIELPGNFGGRVRTHRTLRFSLFLFESLIAITPQVRLWNCADGAMIAGTLPADLYQMRSGAAAQLRQETVDKIVRATVPDGVAVNRKRIERFKAAFADWLARTQRVVAGLDPASDDLITLHDALRAGLYGGPETIERRAIRLLVEGSLMMMFHHAFHHARRHGLIADSAYLSLVLGEYRTALEAMAIKFDQVFDLAMANSITV